MGRKLRLHFALVVALVLLAGGLCYWQFSQPRADLDGRRVAVLIGSGYYDSEATTPIDYLIKAGAQVLTVGPEQGAIAGSRGGTVEVTCALDEIDPGGIDCLVIPGGTAPLTLREDPRVIALVNACAAQGKLLAVVGRGARILIRAEIVSGRRMTTWSDTWQELQAAGAELLDQAVVRDGNLITTRGPDDLGRFCQAIAEALEQR